MLILEEKRTYFTQTNVQLYHMSYVIMWGGVGVNTKLFYIIENMSDITISRLIIAKINNNQTNKIIKYIFDRPL